MIAAALDTALQKTLKSIFNRLAANLDSVQKKTTVGTDGSFGFNVLGGS